MSDDKLRETVPCPECGAPCEHFAELHADRSPGYVYKAADAPPTEPTEEMYRAGERELSDHWQGHSLSDQEKAEVRAIIRAALMARKEGTHDRVHD